RPVLPAAWVCIWIWKKLPAPSSPSPMWNRPIQFAFVSGRTQNDVVKFDAPCSRLSGRSTAFALEPPDRSSALPRTPLADHPAFPVRVAAPTEESVPVLAADVPVASSNS